MQLGHLPRHLAKVKPPPWLECLPGKSRRRSWKSRADPKHLRTSPPCPLGYLVSVDQLVIRTLDIKPKRTVKITFTPIEGTQLFADHSSILPFIHCHPLENLTPKETSKTKVSSERMAAKCGVTIPHYHTENGRFTYNVHIKECTACIQTTYFCGVNVHFQNVIAEGNIGHMKYSTCAILLNAIINWLETISLEL